MSHLNVHTHSTIGFSDAMAVSLRTVLVKEFVYSKKLEVFECQTQYHSEKFTYYVEPNSIHRYFKDHTVKKNSSGKIREFHVDFKHLTSHEQYQATISTLPWRVTKLKNITDKRAFRGCLIKIKEYRAARVLRSIELQAFWNTQFRKGIEEGKMIVVGTENKVTILSTQRPIESTTQLAQPTTHTYHFVTNDSKSDSSSDDLVQTYDVPTLDQPTRTRNHTFLSQPYSPRYFHENARGTTSQNDWINLTYTARSQHTCRLSLPSHQSTETLL